VSDVFPATTEDERDPREDQNEDRRREEEIKGDKPPHHGWFILKLKLALKQSRSCRNLNP